MELVARHGDREEPVHVERVAGGYRVRVGERVYEVDATAVAADTRSLVVGGRQHEVSVHRQRDGRYLVTGQDLHTVVEVTDPLTHLARHAAGEAAGPGTGVVHAMMPGRVVKLLAAEGDPVTAGRGVVVLEAMKMENEIQAEGDGTIVHLFVAEGQSVEGGDPLFEVG